MGVTAKRTLAVTVGALGMVLVAMSVAWACSANRHMDPLSQNEGMPGMAIAVSNAQWVANGQTGFSGSQVEVRWAEASTTVQPHNVATRTQLLGTAPLTDTERPNQKVFSASVRVPEGIAGGDYLLYVVGEEKYPVRDIAAAGVRIIGGNQPETVGQTPGVTEPAPAEDAAPTTGATPTPAGEQAPAPGVSAPAPTPAAPAPAPAATTPVRELVNANVATQPEARVPAGLTDGSSATASSGETVPAALTNGYVAPTSEAPVQATSPVPDTAETDSTAPTSGFSSPERSGYEWAGMPETSGANPGVGAGLALLSGGMVLLLAGFTLATVSRRREKAKVAGS